MDKLLFSILFGLLVIIGNEGYANQNNPVNSNPLPLASIGNFSYKGAFAMDKKAVYGDSRNKYAAAFFELSADRSSFYFGGRKVDTAIGEFELPELVLTEKISALNVAKEKQNYSSILGTKKDRFNSKRITTGNPQKIDRITGLMLHNGTLVANVTKYYDGKGSNTHTTVLIDNPEDLANSKIYGYFSMEGAAHASGWISEIPPEWQASLGGEHITGWASNFPIARRNSTGPSAFVVNLDDISPSTDTDDLISTTALMDFNLRKPLHTDIYNNNKTTKRNNKNQGTIPVVVGNNDLWTVVSWAVYGFIIPNTRTYAVFGSSGGHNSGLGYKINQDNGQRCSGPCAVKHDDYYNYYWLFNVDDLVAVKNGKKSAHEIRPYDYGIFPAPFQTQPDTKSKEFMPIRPIRGGDFDHESNTLYLVLGGSLQVQQIVIAYDFSLR